MCCTGTQRSGRYTPGVPRFILPPSLFIGGPLHGQMALGHGATFVWTETGVPYVYVFCEIDLEVTGLVEAYLYKRLFDLWQGPDGDTYRSAVITLIMDAKTKVGT